MKIILLGTGSPIFDLNRQHSSVLVEIGDDKLLFDSGRGVTMQIGRSGISLKDVRNIFITHHHYDHICDLGEFLMTAWHNNGGPFNIYGPYGTAKIVNAFIEQIFARDIDFALSSEDDAADLKNMVRVNEIAPGPVQDNGRWKVLAEFVNHGNSLGLSPESWSCFGYRLEAQGKVIAVSGDTIACEGLNQLANEADCLIQCCYLADAEITNAAFEHLAKNVIASSGEVGKIAAHNKVKKLVLTHFRPKSEAMMQSILDDVRKDFNGETILGEDLMSIEV